MKAGLRVLACVTLGVTIGAGSAFAACSNPPGTAGDQIYSATYNMMQFCDGANWINMGANAGLGTLTAGDFCTSDGTVINCTTGVPFTVPQGGTGATTLTAHGVVIGEGASAVAITAAGTANQILMSAGASADPVWSTATYPATTTINQILFSSSANAVAGITTGNNGVLVTSSGGVPSISSTLPSAVQGNITSTGTIASGVWNGTVITGTYGGTGVNNGASTITLAGNFATSGANSLTLTTTGSTNVTLPTSGTLVTTGVATLSSLASIGTITTGVWNGTKIGLAYGGTNADLSATGGTHQVLKQSSSGAAVTVGQLACADLSNSVASCSTDTTSASNISSGTLGVAEGGTGLNTFTSNVIYKGNGASALATSALTDNGTIVSTSESIDLTSKAVLTEIANDGSTGTTVNKLAKLTGAPSTAIIASTSDTSGVVGIVTGGAGTTSNAQIAVSGQASCLFENTTVAGDYVQIGSSTAGDCHDAGSTYPTSGQVLGRVLASGSAGTYAVNLFGPGAKGGGGGSLASDSDVTITSVANNDMLKYDSGSSKWVNAPISSAIAGVAGPTFMVNKNGTNQTVTNGTATKLTWGTVVFDTNNNFSSSRFTPTVAGKYIITLAAYCTDSTSFCLASIEKNGSRTNEAFVYNASSSQGVATTVLDMNGSTDYVEGYAINSGGTTVSGDTKWTYFTGAMLAPLTSGVVAGTGSAGYVPYWTSGNAITYDSTSGGQFYWDSTNHHLGIGTAAPATSLGVNGDVAFLLGGDLTTTGSQNDVAVGAASAIRYNGGGTATFTGIASGQPGKLLYLHNASSSTLTISNQSASSSAANRVITGTGADLALAAGSSVQMQYDGSASRWRIVGGSGGGGITSSTAGQVAYFQSTGATIIGTSTLNVSGGAVGIGTATPAATGLLDLTSTTKGFLPPRMTTTQRDAISSPATGLMIYNTTNSQFEFYTGSTWSAVASAIPNGAIAAFASASCPSGWTEYTAARGRFLRGIDNGAGNDPDGTRTAGGTQADMFKSHTHGISPGDPIVQNGSGGGYRALGSDTIQSAATGGAETRPKNVAVTFCQYSGGTYSPNVGALTANNFCAADATGTQIVCGTSSTGSGNVVLATTPTITTSATVPLVIGGTVASSTLTLESTSGSGTSDAVIFKTGSQSERMRIDTSGKVGIGTATPSTNLDVYNGNESTTLTNFTQAVTNAGILITTDYTANAYTPGIFWRTQDNNPTKPTAGVWVKETASGTNLYFGVSNAYATGITNTTYLAPGGQFYSQSSDAYGLYGRTTASGFGGVTGYSADNATFGILGHSNAYGVYGYSAAGYGAYGYGAGGVYGDGSSWGGYFHDGGSGCQTYVSYAGYAVYGGCANGIGSDARLKTDIKPLVSALGIVDKLNPVSFHWKEGSDEARAHKELQFGLIAQEVQKIIPEVVGSVDMSKLPEDPKDKGKPKSLNRQLGKTYAVAYDMLIPFALAAVKELKTLFDSDHAAVVKLQADNDNLRSELKAANDNEAKALEDVRQELRTYKAAHP